MMGWRSRTVTTRRYRPRFHLWCRWLRRFRWHHRRETIKLSDYYRPSDGEHKDNLLTQERADQVRADVANNRSSSDGYSDGHSR